MTLISGNLNHIVNLSQNQWQYEPQRDFITTRSGRRGFSGSWGLLQTCAVRAGPWSCLWWPYTIVNICKQYPPQGGYCLQMFTVVYGHHRQLRVLVGACRRAAPPSWAASPSAPRRRGSTSRTAGQPRGRARATTSAAGAASPGGTSRGKAMRGAGLAVADRLPGGAEGPPGVPPAPGARASFSTA